MTQLLAMLHLTSCPELHDVVCCFGERVGIGFGRLLFKGTLRRSLFQLVTRIAGFLYDIKALAGCARCNG